MKNYQGNEFLAPLNKNLEEKILKWYPSDTKEQFEKQKNIIFYKNLYGPDDIIYKLNNYNFRCDNFKDDSYNNPYRILFMGCSFTFGIGLPLHDVWAKIMHERICTELNQDIPYWNLAWGGSGTDQMYRYLYHLGPKLRPQIIISLTSFLERRELFANNGEFLPNHKPDEVSKKEFHSYIQVLTEKKLVRYLTEKNFASINMLLEKWNCLMLSFPIDYQFDFSNIQLSNIKHLNFQWKWVDNARDGTHPGPTTNKHMADTIFEQSWPYIKDKLNLSNIS